MVVPAESVIDDYGVRTTLGDDVLLTCRALRPNPLPHHEVVTVERVGAG